jgi:IS30 family transposase
MGKRKRTCTREVRTVAFKAVAYLKITYGEYTAQCDCCTTFRNTPEGVLPKAHYDNKVRDLVLDRIIKDGMSIERILESLRREFLLELSSGFVYNVLRDRVKELDMSEHRRMVLEQFSGTLCTTIPENPVVRARFSGSVREFFNGSLSGRVDCGNLGAARCRKLIAMCPGDLADETMSTEQRQVSPHSVGLLAV